MELQLHMLPLLLMHGNSILPVSSSPNPWTTAVRGIIKL